MPRDNRDVQVAHNNRAARQQAVVDWGLRVFGDDAPDRRNLALRFLEEAMELVQTQGLSPHDVGVVAARVFNRPVGDIKNEIGGVQVALYCHAGELGLDVDSCEATEVVRIHTIPAERFQAKQIEKKVQGLQ